MSLVIAYYNFGNLLPDLGIRLYYYYDDDDYMI
jgi:hypothetical protein